MKASILKLRGRGAIGAAALFVLLVAINGVVAGLRWRADLTDERLFTLSEGTLGLLRALPRSAQLKLYVTRGEAMPIPLRQYAQRVQDLLREYVRAAGGRVTLEVHDPKPFSDEEEWARKYGVEGRSLNPLGGGPEIYLGLAAVSGTREAVLPFLSPENEPRLEYEITRMLHEVTRARKPKIGVASSLGLFGAPPSPFGGPRPTAPWTFIRELQALYDVTEVSLTDDRLPEELTALILVHPRDADESFLYAVDQYVVHGGRLLVFTDPLCLAELENRDPRRMALGGMGAQSDLNRLTQAWGLSTPASLAADPAAATPVRAGEGPPRLNLGWLSLREDALARDEIATSGLATLMLPFAGAYSGTAPEGLTLTPLLQTSAEAGWSDPAMILMGGDLSQPPPPDPAARLIALRLTGFFPSAFPDGRPGEKKPEGAATAETPAPAPDSATAEPAANEARADAEAPAAAKDAAAAATPPATEPAPSPDGRPPHLKKGIASGTAILVADVDMLYDRFAVERANFLGYEMAQLANDNLNLAWNLVEQLAGSEALIGLRSRGRFDRPFRRVLEIERRAAAQWRAEEERLQEQLRQTRERLAQMQARRDPNQQVILTEEQRREIERFRNEQFQTQRQLKEVEKNRRREIEQLGWTLKLINLGAAPTAVAVFGLVRGWRRRRRAGG